jgi:hypothetical protein
VREGTVTRFDPYFRRGRVIPVSYNSLKLGIDSLLGNTRPKAAPCPGSVSPSMPENSPFPLGELLTS